MHRLLDCLTGDAEIASMFAPEAEIDAILRFEVALAWAQAEAGLIEPAAAAAIESASAGFVPDVETLSAGLRRDGVVVPELVRQMRVAVGKPHGTALHLGATSQDAIDTGLMLRLKRILDLLDGRLGCLLHGLDAAGQADGQAPLMAYTRMQAALPITVAEKVARWSVPLVGHRRRLEGLKADLAIQLGGPVGDGRGLRGEAAAIRQGLARRLGLADVRPWHSDRTRILDVAQGFALLTGTLGKLGQDIALMAERGEVGLSGGGTSSAMAHKNNPVGAELLVALGRLNAGLMGALHQSMIHENERSGAAWTLEWMILPQMAEAAGAALNHAVSLMEGARLGLPASI